MFLNFDTGTPAPTHSPATRAPLTVAVGIALYLVSMIFVSAQLIVKAKLGKLGVEDILISISAVRYSTYRVADIETRADIPYLDTDTRPSDRHHYLYCPLSQTRYTR